MFRACKNKNVGPPLLLVLAIVDVVFLIQNPVTVLTVRYCGKFFAPPEKSQKTHSFFLRFLDLLGLRLNLLSLGSSC